MNKRFLAVLLMAAVAAASLTVLMNGSANKDYVRIHIRANSDSEFDQAIKLEVRDAVVAYLTPLLENCKDAASAKKRISDHLDEIAAVADAVLRGRCSYVSNASLRRERFAEKDYGDLKLPEGIYDALILDLGAAEGANWWCVAFPPLCFAASDEEGTEYKSKIMEIIEKNKEGKHG
jgi:stage II sporulation protein R